MMAIRSVTYAFGTLVFLAGCGDPTVEETPERIRAIKPYYVSEPAGANLRTYSGTVSPSDTSGLAFAVAGTVATVDVNQGDRVTGGQVLATLDPEPFELNVQAAKSELASARANFADKKTALDRQRQLHERGWVAKAALDQAIAAHDAAEGDLNLARSRLGAAERDLANTRLIAPFGGLIAERSVEPFEEISVGQVLLLINSDGALEVTMSVPDSVVARIALGAPVTVDVSTAPGCGCTGRVTEIGSLSSAANAVTVKATLIQSTPALIPGMTAEVTVPLSGGPEAPGYLIPLEAIAPGGEGAQGHVFRYDPETGSVRRVFVKGGEGVRDNLVAIVEGVNAGDIIAAAGVSFLRDGQAVTLLGQEN